MTRHQYGPAPVFGADGQLARARPDGIVTFDEAQTLPAADVALTPSGAATGGYASSDERGACTLWGPDNYRGGLWVDFGSGPMPIFPPLLLGDATAATASGGVPPESIGPDELQDNAVERRHLSTGAVGSDEIEDGAVGPNELAANAVETLKVKDEAVTEPKLGDDSVSRRTIQMGAVGPDELQYDYIIDPPAAVPGQYLMRTEDGWIGTAPPSGGGGGGSTVGITSWDAYGAVADAVLVTASTTSGSAVATISGLTSADVGKLLSIPGAAGTVNGHLVKIGAVSGTSVTMHALGTSSPTNASATVTTSDAIVGTDNTAAMDACMTAVEAAGGGYIYGSGRYLRNRALLLRSGCHIRGGAISTRWSGNPHPIWKTVIAPGFVHGAAANLSTPATSYEHWTASAIVRGQTTVTATGTSTRGRAGGLSAVPDLTGQLIGIRTLEASVTSGVEVPYRLTFAHCRAHNGNTLELDEPIPWDVTNARVFIINPSDTAVTGGPLGAPTWIVQNASVEDVELDGFHPVWGGGAYKFRMARVRPREGKRWNEGITLNTMVKSEITDISMDWGYTFIEIKFGSYKCAVRRCSGTFTGSGTVYTPVGIGESSTEVTIEDCDMTIPSAFSDATKVLVDLRDCSEPRILNNRFHLAVGNIDAAIAIPSQTNALRVVRGALISGNVFTGNGNVGRIVKVGPAVTSGVRHQGMTIINNRFAGTLKSAVNEAFLIHQVDDLLVTGNVIDGVTTGVGPSQINTQQVTGHWEPVLVTSSAGGGFSGAEQVYHGYMDFSDANVPATVDFGVLPNRCYITRLVVDVETAVAGVTGTLSVGHSATAGLFCSGQPLTSTGVFEYRHGSAPASGGGSVGAGFRRLGGFSSTSTRLARMTFSGTLPSDRTGITGKVRVLLYVVPTTPDK